MADHVDSDDLNARFDARSIAQLASDTGTAIAITQFSTDVNVTAALDSAEGEILSALLVGGRYTADDLTALTGSHQAYLKDLICRVAMLLLLRRRPKVDAKLYEQLNKFWETNLKALQDGKAIFGGNQSDIDASRANVDGISYNDMVNINSIRTRKGRYFPVPDLPVGRQ